METNQQVQLRRHLHELRRATRGIGQDFAVEFQHLDDQIARLGSLTAQEAKEALLDIQDDFAALGRSIETELRRLPGRMADGLSRAGQGLESGAIRAATATRDALESAGHATKESTKNALASLAGVRRTPMKEWSPPSSDDS
jgi:hypothetical protein